MSAKDDGGPAFPSEEYEWNDGAMQRIEHEGPRGMSLRDWFAGQELVKVKFAAVCDKPAAYDTVADHCYRMADAMLRERKK